MNKYHIEKEYKIKLNKNTYEQLTHNLDFNTKNIQINYYYSALNDMGIRIREENNTYTFTLKYYKDNKVREYNIDLDNNDINHPDIKKLLDELNVKDIKYLGKLVNERINIDYPKAILSLDKSTYLGITNYELEYELKDANIDDINNLKEILMTNNIECVFSNDTKYTKFNNAKNAKAAIFCADGLEECEALMVYDLLKRAGIYVELISIKDDLHITSSHNLYFRCDELFTNINKDAYDILILPGGLKGTENLSNFEPLIELIKKYKDENKLIAAICAAPSIFIKNGLVKDKQFTVYPGFESGLESSNKKVYVDNDVITAKGLGAAIDFSYAIISLLIDTNKADEILKEIMYL